MIYFDSAYLAKCYLPETGHLEVRAAACRAGSLQSVALAQIEVASVFHRHFREGRISAFALGRISRTVFAGLR